MEYCFEEPTIKKVKVNIEPCPRCGSEQLDICKRNTGNGADTFGGFACIECKVCHHKVKEQSNDIGYGDTLDGLFNQALGEWNCQSRRELDRDKLLVKALTVAFKFDEFKTAHIVGNALVWTKPDGGMGSLLLSDIESELDKRLQKGTVTK